MGADRNKRRQSRFLLLLVVMKGAQAPFFLPSFGLLRGDLGEPRRMAQEYYYII
jgi:hypothetical protein